ncbi:Recombination protein MgsA [Desulfonauticus submarinus]|uniref:Replication-associated recombination protein A n=1 Tax=Desulfonauticus submarinus TaxID=206665 RepID=A0A1H0CFX8_9BACT|nr:replication-associated recombination protein A [Desulfonauticus submarinus]SDN56798.1 Recombination protein MgsA [Desulfonauticus submarinus]
MSVHTPLAEKLRPNTLEEFVGQSHLKNRIKAIIQAKRLQSLLFFGPPGCGKSTLAILLAKSWNKKYLRVSAPEIGLSGLRQKIKNIDILILDEIHRFSKAQQDFFLPLLETGEITLLATTTENPSFSITRQLLSRLHVLKLASLTHQELLSLAQKAVSYLNISIPKESLEILISLSGGDARTLLNLIEYLSNLKPNDLSPANLKTILPEIVIKGDRQGDSHYELISALIKSIRGSDPDASLYYLACLLEGGEDPRFICRRLILSASEDIGLADPMALPLAVSCAEAIDLIGMPEGFIPLAETVVYLALAPKSNSTYAAYLSAQKEVRLNGPKPVPLHLRNPSTRLHKEWGYGQGYKYPHAYPGSYVAQDYLPEGLKNRQFYFPKSEGMETRLNLWLKQKKKQINIKKSK